MLYLLINLPYDYLVEPSKDDMTPRDFIFLFIELRHEIFKALGLE